ncbi:MAG: hypothetical protein Q9195_008626 [Heterodermia aff. obscurata]
MRFLDISSKQLNPGIALSATPVPSSTTSSVPPSTNATSLSSSDPPPLPSKPSTLNSVVNRTASNYSPYNSTARYGASPYGGVGGYGTGYGSYSSPYSRFGGMANSMYGNYGGYGSMYGGMGGMGGMYGQPGMMGGDPNDPNSLTNSMSNSTQATFQMIESLVGAFGGFAQMLESTYMATHSSFFAMVSVAEQFSNLRNTLGSILGIFTLLRWLRTLLAKITGRPPPADATSLTPSAFASFQGLASTSSSSQPGAPPTPSRKPFVIFLLAVFGLPYLMTKLIRSLAKSAEEHQQQQQLITHPDPTNPYAPLEQSSQPLDPSKLDFCRVLYDYPPPSSPLPPPSSSSPEDLSVKKGDLVAVLSKTDPMGQSSDWWRCRARDGRMGWLPSVYLEIVQRRQRQLTEKGDGEDGRVNTMSTLGESRSNSLKKEEKVPIPVPVISKGGGIGEGTAGESTVEGFQRGGFYS